MTSATDELRRLLDERDEYYKTSGNKTWWGRPIDMQTGKPINVFHYQAQPMGEDRLFVELQLATPEQAIAATLGPNVTGNTSDGYHTFNELYHRASIEASMIQTHGYIELPKDADGEYIHIGDVMEERSGHTFEVASLMAFGGSDNWLVLSDPRNFSSFREPHDIRHHHKPTVEDVMVEFATDWESAPDGEDKTAVLKKYAAKLRLVNDEE